MLWNKCSKLRVRYKPHLLEIKMRFTQITSKDKDNNYI